MKFVIDACSIILLGKATLLETALASYEIVATSDAFKEVVQGKKNMLADALLAERLNKEKKLVLTEAGKKLIEKLGKDFNMGKGEASSIAAAVTLKGAIITDNRQGRKAAIVNSLPLLGSIEITVDLHRKGKIAKAKAYEALETLKDEGWFEEYLIEKAKEDIKNERS